MSEQIKEKEEYKPIQPMDFKLKVGEVEKVYRYHYELNTVRQVEPAIAVVEHYFNSNDAPQTKITQQMLSGAHLWVTEAMKYLVREVVNNQVQDFRQNSIEAVAEDLRNLPPNEYDNLYKCVTDFFYVIKRQDIASRLLLMKRRMSLEALSSVINSVKKGGTSSVKKQSRQTKSTRCTAQTKATSAKAKQ
jgi:hypothetical protein